MTARALLAEWPDGSSALVWRVGESRIDIVGSGGDVDRPYEWSSVSKAACAWGVARMVSEGEICVEDPAGPPGSTIAHLLSHASGLGLEQGDPTMPVGVRRIYSNVGFDMAVGAAVGGDPSSWFRASVADVLGLDARLAGRPAAGVAGTVRDMATLGAAWLNGPVDAKILGDFVTPYLPDLAGVVPGFGRFDPCWWGLGVEVHGSKRHWMGTVASRSAFGHFGRSGSLLLIDPVSRLVIAAASGAPFGPWAVTLWPRWVDEVMSSSERS